MCQSDCGKRVRVLMIAEACNPEWESVPLVGYNWYKAIRERADVTLVTHVRNRDGMLRAGAPLANVVFIDSELLARPFYRLGNLLRMGRGVGWTTRQAAMWIPYCYFEHLVFTRFRAALRAGQYDIVHRLTPLSPTYASPLASWIDVPFVVGPLNGGLPWPSGWTGTQMAEREFLSIVRNIYRILPYVRKTYQRAACVIAGSQCTASQLRKCTGQSAAYMPENGIDPSRFAATGRRPPSEITPFRILFAGRLVPYKGPDMVLEAVGRSAQLRKEAEVLMVGDGPQLPALRMLVDRFKIQDRVQFVGRVSQAALREYFCNSSVFAFPSVREFGGAVVMEAMACGLPPVVVNYGGPGEFVTRETGIAISMAHRSRLIDSLRCALESLSSSRNRLDLMSQACVARIAECYTWPRKAERMIEFYRSCLTGA